MKDEPVKIAIHHPLVNSSYDIYMAQSLQKAFISNGIDAVHLKGRLAPSLLSRMCHEFGINVLFQFNSLRNEYIELPKFTRHVSWFQDISPSTRMYLKYAKKNGFIRPGDIIFYLGQPEDFTNFDCLTDNLDIGVNRQLAMFSSKLINHDIDLSIAGYIPEPLNIVLNPTVEGLNNISLKISSIPIIGSGISRLFRYINRKRLPFEFVSGVILDKFCKILNDKYTPLTGTLDDKALCASLLDMMTFQEKRYYSIRPMNKFLNQEYSPMYSAIPKRSIYKSLLGEHLLNHIAIRNFSALEQSLDYFTMHYPRLMDRVLLAKLMLDVSSNIKFYGHNWDKHPLTKKYSEGYKSGPRLYDVYCRSKINVANNPHGVGMHSRNLECMALGQFLYLHESARDPFPGGIRSYFEPGVHYGSYTPDNFVEEARRWLKNTRERSRAAENARAAVFASHTWDHRVKQIIDAIRRA